MEDEPASMPTAHKTPPINLTTAPSRDLDADLLVIPVFEDDDLVDEAGLDEASAGDIGAARGRGEFRGKPYDVFVTPLRGWKSVIATGSTTVKSRGDSTERPFTVTRILPVVAPVGTSTVSSVAVMLRSVAGRPLIATWTWRMSVPKFVPRIVNCRPGAAKPGFQLVIVGANWMTNGAEVWARPLLRTSTRIGPLAAFAGIETTSWVAVPR